MKRSMRAAALIIILAPGMFLCSCKKTDTGPRQQPEQEARLQQSFAASKQAVAARVNGAAVSMFTLLREMNAIAPQYLAREQQRTPAIDERIRKDALNNVIVQELAVQEAKKQGLTVKPEAVAAELRKMKAAPGYEATLAQSGMTEDELSRTIERDLLFELIAAREVDQKVTVTEADLRKRYQKEKPGLLDKNHQALTFEAARGVLEEKVRAEKAEQRMRAWEQELKKNATIEIIADKQKR